MVKTVDLRLETEQSLRIPRMTSQIGRHLRGIGEERRIDAAIRVEHRIFGVEDIEGRRAVIRIDHNLDAVPHVVDRVAAQ